MIEPLVDWLRRLKDPLRNDADALDGAPAGGRRPRDPEGSRSSSSATFPAQAGSHAAQVEALLKLDARLEPIIAT